jgi:hypothetical protein
VLAQAPIHFQSTFGDVVEEVQLAALMRHLYNVPQNSDTKRC